MKTLFLWILIPITLWSNTMECESSLTLFDKSVQQKKPISDGLLMMTIVYCEDIPQYRQVLTQMIKILDTAQIQTNTLLTPSSPNNIQ
ncbi:hypothetical protein MN086_04930 [Sulfurovum sp. XGS-02]|uniref:hypothetical protein n=1 Tax=Sulfurovum sp. XGS-02 TaxID=2925411 RepID=UPI00206789DB|nr:hypothetical protein [Sulfurovum sp. XGS-02]UPT78493.1 hypothetical protein MN086_04930 [Sulfurovum sp. XGS-02]